MRYSVLLISLVCIFSFSCKKKEDLRMINIPEGRGIKKAEAAGVKLSMQSYTFRNSTLVEAFEKLNELEIRNIEIYPGHIIGGKWGDKKFDFNLTQEEQQELKELAAQHGVKIVACGVFTTENIGDWEKLFSFAKAMDMEYITCEPKYEHLDLVEKLAVETGIEVGIHNHPQPSDYWNPQLLLANIENRSELIGSCADVGHWNREGLDQIECLQDLRGRIQSLHLKDIEFKRRHEDGRVYQKDMLWGLGVLDVDAIMLELKRQGFEGYATMEYETYSENLMQNLKDCIFYYDVVSDETFE